MVVPVIALTVIVLVGLLAIFRRYLAERDRLDREMMQAQRKPVAAKQDPASMVFVHMRRHAA